MQFTDLLGYAASIFVVISLLMSDIKLLRYVNFVGCVLFVIYGVYIAAYPVAVMNFVASGINIYHLLRLRKRDSLA